MENQFLLTQCCLFFTLISAVCHACASVAHCEHSRHTQFQTLCFANLEQGGLEDITPTSEPSIGNVDVGQGIALMNGFQ